ncbi:MAG: choice-of-anchor B family protein [Crocinitomicaceae bacterium]|nr:choice-of-anchor B family protein [Crocinitomicaceae bacterium]MDP4869050.1 choice-of-anchor B family protein [Crocinitomicaceae bacterium]
MKYVLFFLLSLVGSSTFAQFAIDSLSHIDYQALHDANLNDVWGYTDELGNEYAIVGTSKGTSIVDITNGAQPQEVFWLPGSESIWRDPCVYGDYAYVTTEAEDGLLIIDLSPLPQSVNLSTALYTGPAANPWQSAHTCYTSESGYAYIFGANRGNGGVIILDLNTNPMQPVEVGVFDMSYVHDGFERNDTLYTGHIYDGYFCIVDVSDHANPVLLATHPTPNLFTHNIWPSADGSVVYTTDEISGAYVAAYDISNLQQIQEIDRVQNAQGTSVVPHNVHVKGAYLVTSYYSDGIVVHDAHDPQNLIKLGSFDTYPGQTPGFDGCWGVYPFFGSNKAVAADITEGLFVLQINYAPAASLVGEVKDLITGQLLEQVSVALSGAAMTEKTNAQGVYKTGMPGSGSYVINVNKPGYYPQTMQVNLTAGQTTTLNFNLLPIPPFNLQIKVVEQGSTVPLSNVQIRLRHPQITHEGQTNGLGEEDFTLFYQDTYELILGKWGYQTVCSTPLITASTQTLLIELPKGFYDDFTFDFGWSVAGDAETGMWERAVPNPTTNTMFGNDSNLDCGALSMVTGNGSTPNPDQNDVDKGFTTLISPTFNLNGLSTPHLSYARSFYCYHGPGNFDDTLLVVLSNGLDQVVLEEIIAPQGQAMSWEYKSFALNGLLPFTNNMQLFVRTADYPSNPNITEAAFDHWRITNESIIGTEELSTAKTFKMYPNPGQDQVSFGTVQEELLVRFFQLDGKLTLSASIAPGQTTINVQSLPEGAYIVEIAGQRFSWIKLGQ